ncbi:hypothetical protein CUJ91_04695 [Paraburkholderia graminis]|uniref:helix-turn-helix domain-containing protein n=1 Tax=Paraburkholderia graminis TaxID=60548 RepID=UPI000DEF7FC5|nr:helix-turn-helix domain-containing protein [Paraburkholderia graminis]AXF07295.1 hypothetical protein CUJ91_04695 [Paraburkholderia graminis]
MSFQAMTWAVEQELPALQKLVLLMLANCTNQHTRRCDPSHDRLAKECGMSKDSVKRAIAELAEKGLIEVRRQSSNGVNLPNQYTLKVGSSVGVVGADSTQGVDADSTHGRCSQHPGVGADTTEGGCSQQGGVGADSTTNQEVKPGSKPKSIKVPLPENFAISERVREWAAEKGHGRLEERFEHFVGTAKAKGYKYVDWDSAFENAVRDDWAKLGRDQRAKTTELAW